MYYTTTTPKKTENKASSQILTSVTMIRILPRFQFRLFKTVQTEQLVADDDDDDDDAAAFEGHSEVTVRSAAWGSDAV